MGIQICSNKGADPFWFPIRGKIRKILINLQKSSSHEPTSWNALIFSMEHPWAKFVQIKSLGSRMTPLQGLKLLHSNIYGNA